MTPPAEVTIDEPLIRRLLGAQHPDLKDLPLRIMDSGWDNVMVRVGDDLALRLPRRKAGAPLILNEQKWLPWLAPQLPLPVPVPLRTGVPTADYPFYWSVQKWLPGEPADLFPPASEDAVRLAQFLQALHRLPLPNDPPTNPSREGPLSGKASDIESRMADLEHQTEAITPAIVEAWNLAKVTQMIGPPCFIAGDMHARNILTQKGRLSAIIDWGDMCAGDPATDMMGVWGLFDAPQARAQFFKTYGGDTDFMRRARGWAIFSGVILLHTGLKDTPRHAQMGSDVLRRIHEDVIADHNNA